MLLHLFHPRALYFYANSLEVQTLYVYSQQIQIRMLYGIEAFVETTYFSLLTEILLWNCYCEFSKRMRLCQFCHFCVS